MGAELVRRYNYNQAKRVTDGLERIINRISKNTPHWMMKELNDAYRISQCIQQEHKLAIRGFGEKI